MRRQGLRRVRGATGAVRVRDYRMCLSRRSLSPFDALSRRPLIMPHTNLITQRRRPRALSRRHSCRRLDGQEDAAAALRVVDGCCACDPPRRRPPQLWRPDRRWRRRQSDPRGFVSIFVSSSFDLASLTSSHPLMSQTNRPLSRRHLRRVGHPRRPLELRGDRARRRSV